MEDKLTKLMATMFQNMFPSINIQTVSLCLFICLSVNEVITMS